MSLAGKMTFQQLCELAAGYAQDIPLDLIVALIDEESGGNPKAVSPDNAQGLMQIMKRFHPKDDLFDPKTNVQIGCNILRQYDQFVNKGGFAAPSWSDWQKVRRVLAAYVMGPHNVAPYPDESGWSEPVVNYCNIIESLTKKGFCT